MVPTPEDSSRTSMLHRASTGTQLTSQKPTWFFEVPGSKFISSFSPKFQTRWGGHKFTGLSCLAESPVWAFKLICSAAVAVTCVPGLSHPQVHRDAFSETDGLRKGTVYTKLCCELYVSVYYKAATI